MSEDSSLACPDWWDRLQAGRVPIRDGIPIDEERGERAVRALNMLRLADVPGNPAMADAGGDWFRDIVRTMFGAIDPLTRARWIRELFLLVPKKNSKTTNGALMMLVALLLNERPSAPFALMAPVQDTANEAFEVAAGAIELDPVLSRKLHVRNHLKTIVHRETKADLQIMTFDPDVLTGKKFCGALLDEVHVIAKSAKASKAIRQVRGGMVPFPEAFLAMITTMPDDPPVGVMLAELTKAREIRDGKRTGAMLPVLYELPREIQQSPGALWRDRALWPYVTPNLGRSVTVEALDELYQDAAAKGDGELRGWASQHLNLEIGLALLSNRWAGADFWEAAGIIECGLETILAQCDVATVGVDGGGLDDLLGLAVIGRHRETRQWLAWTRAWAHTSVLDRRKSEAERLRDFERDGDLVIVGHMGEDVDELADIVSRVYEAGLMESEDPDKPEPRIGADPYGVGGILEAIVSAGVPRELVIGVSQGWKLGAAIKTAERKLAEGVLVHGGQRLMAWCVGNARVEPKGNAILITKQASGTAKIDPLMALFNAASLMAMNPDSGGKSFWETEETAASA